MSGLGLEFWNEAVRGLREAFTQAESRLCAYDGAIGGGDHGTSMLLGLTTADRRLRERPPADVGALLHQMGRAFLEAVGGVAGIVFGSLFIGAGEGTAGARELDTAGLHRAFEAGLSATKAKTKVNEGDKSMVDALAPAVAVLADASAKGLPPAEALRLAAQAAASGLELEPESLYDERILAERYGGCRMNSRERVLAAIGRRLPDRTPADYKGEPEVNERLMARMGVKDYEAMLEALQIDIRRIEPRYQGPPAKSLPGGITEDYWGIRSRSMRTAVASYDMFVPTALWSASSLAELERHPWPTPDLFDYSVMAGQAARWPEHAVLYEGSDLFTRPSILRGMENLLVDMAQRPEMAHFVIGKFADFYAEDLTRALEATRGGFQLYCEWSDYGTQGGLILSPQMWREFAGPYLKRLADICHSAGVAFMLHSCGAVRELIPDFISIGVDVLDPIQTMAEGMEPAGLKRDFGKRIAFHGGIDTQSTLPFGSPREVRAEVRHRVATLGKEGGYILAPSHNIQPDTPLQNILAMYEPELRAIP